LSKNRAKGIFDLHDEGKEVKFDESETFVKDENGRKDSEKPGKEHLKPEGEGEEGEGEGEEKPKGEPEGEMNLLKFTFFSYFLKVNVYFRIKVIMDYFNLNLNITTFI